MKKAMGKPYGRMKSQQLGTDKSRATLIAVNNSVEANRLSGYLEFLVTKAIIRPLS